MSAQEVPNPGLDQGESAVSQDTPTPSPSAVKTEPGATTASNGKVGEDSGPAEICVVIGGSRNSHAQGSYVCGICGKKYKYYNCFQTHVRAHRESESAPGEGGSQGMNSEYRRTLSIIHKADSFRYTCDICGKKYKYFSCFQEHRDLHAVDDPYDHIIPLEDNKEEVEQFQKIGPKTGSYTCEFCGKQYKYFNPYQEHVALHTPISHSFDMQSPRAHHRGKDANKLVSSKSEQGPSDSKHRKSGWNPDWLALPQFNWLYLTEHESSFRQKVENKIQPSLVDNNNSQNSSGTASPLTGTFPSTKTDNENHTKVESPKGCSAPVAQDQLWKSPPPAQKNHIPFPENRLLPEKERQQVAERLLRLMSADLGLLSALNSKDFLKLAQTLVDTGARHGAYNLREALGADLSSLALKQLPRMYNQVKVKVTCALGSNSSLGIAVTCHSQTVGPDACYVLTAYQVEGFRPRRYVLGVKEAGLREGPEQVHHWVQNVLSEFVMSEMRTVYVMEARLATQAFCGRGGLCLRCAGCSLGGVIQAVLGRRSLQARGLHELGELLATCRNIASTTNLPRGGVSDSRASEEFPAPTCWDTSAEALLQVHENFEAICEAYGRSKSTAPLLQGLNKHLLGTLAGLLAPLRQAALELSSERRATLQNVLPVYLRLEKLFTAKAGEAGAGSKLCHYFLEALKENFKVERAHQVAMVLDPQLKLRPVPTYQHDEIMGRVCEMAIGMDIGERAGSGGAAAVGVGARGGSGGEDRDGNGSPVAKRSRLDGGGIERPEETQVRKELFQYFAEPLFNTTSDLFHYWSSSVDKYPKLARLALWLLAVPAVGIRSECVSVCQQSLAMKRKRQVTGEEMNKLVFLKTNMA
ncbi:zinc finger protein 618 isoform X3 [Denticeps clupeoides]|uniref:zinc finger protein 618 isoform X3 n=1 Tax=Denticeps clupeoides TaxID=299321 RepID=UPI0010A37089|nr:zinc finger protein 618-like isoform X3 [Denticeps clupeoides]